MQSMKDSTASTYSSTTPVTKSQECQLTSGRFCPSSSSSQLETRTTKMVGMPLSTSDKLPFVFKTISRKTLKHLCQSANSRPRLTSQWCVDSSRESLLSMLMELTSKTVSLSLEYSSLFSKSCQDRSTMRFLLSSVCFLLSSRWPLRTTRLLITVPCSCRLSQWPSIITE